MTDATSNVTHYVSPSELAYRITTTRSTMAGFTAKGVEAYTTGSNQTLLQQHLSRTSYTSGGIDSKKGKGPYRRDPRGSSGR